MRGSGRRKLTLGMVLAGAILMGAVHHGTVARAQGVPLFDPTTGVCSSYPQPAIPGSWQVSAPRGYPGAVSPGDSVQIGLRDKFGDTDDYDVTATVLMPDGSVAQADTTLTGTDWAYLQFPDDFDSGSTYLGGAYTILWTIDDSLVACDGFAVGS